MAKNSRAFSDVVDRRLSSVTLSAGMQNAIRQRAMEEDAPPAPARRAFRLRRFATVAVAACLCCVLGVGVAASVSPGFERFIQRMGEDFRHLVRPLHEEDIRDGIRMEVLAAVNNNDSAIVYLALTDTMAARIDDTAQLLHVQMDGGNSDYISCWGDLVDYDDETRTAYYRLEADGADGISGETVNLQVHSVLAGVQEYDISTGLTLADITAQSPAPVAMPLPTEGGLYSNGYSISYGESPGVAEAMDAAIDNGTMQVLAQPGQQVLTDAPWLEDVNTGVIDPYLHVRFSPRADAALYTYTNFYLTWPSAPANTWPSPLATAEIHHGKAVDIDGREFYPESEQILEMPPDVPAENVQLAVNGARYSEYIEGKWEVAFALEDNPALLEGDFDIDMNGWHVQHIFLSSIGITAYGTGEMGPDSLALDMEVVMDNGQVVRSISSFTSGDSDGNIQMRSGFARPIDIEQVAKVTVNGKEITLLPAQAPPVAA